MNRQNKLLFVASVVITTIILVIVFFRPEKPVTIAQDVPKQISLGLALQPTCSLAILAMDQGFFEKEGLSVKPRYFPSGKRALLEGLVPGEVDVAIAADIPITMLAFKDRQLRILTTLAETGDANTIVARRDGGITVPGDLKDKRIATQQGSAVHYFLYLFLRKHQISKKSVKLSFMKAEQLPKALAEGAIDAFSMREPYIGEARKLLGDQAITFSAPGIYPQTDMAVARQPFIQDNSAAVRSFILALLTAERFAKQNPEQAVKIIAHRLGAEPKQIAELWPKLHLGATLHQSLALLLDSQARWALREGLVNGDNIPDYTSHMHLDTLRNLRQEAVTVIR
jgi:NitT/TauT family transport system substrate-binding protein